MGGISGWFKGNRQDKSDANKIVKGPLSQEDVKDRIQAYAGQAEKVKDRMELLRIEKNFIETEKKKTDDRVKQTVHYAQGIRTGLPHAPFEQIQDGHNRQDQFDRKRILDQAKAFYNDHLSLKKRFQTRAAYEPDQQKNVDPPKSGPGGRD